ncbi:methionyl-tRNA formyltransferase [Gallionella capsiferriformans]|uniref:Methionyl-tRNA formyltransferase n=1 Tax=Gallionella capsiferriformans (strain ES-2) TaxID=395494 RepID=D9SHN5_GALCS|nr:methionyl-tRNA formyltransferase [Gallionella capsiferriformans]ADL54068.1 methionyl-tRNA formyltransferase [Gallionella capsiferriformans ES-2]
MKIIFAGTPHFAASALEALLKEHQVAAVLTQPDRPSGRGMQLTASPVKLLALAHGIPVLQPESLKTEQAQSDIKALDADVMVVAAYGLILPKAVLELPRLGCLNIHASLLPRWRGAAPIQRAILAGDTETGITIMQMDVGLDTGDILLTRRCTIDAHDNAQTLHDKLAALGAASIVEALRADNVLTPVAQDNDAACYAAKLLKGEALIDWTQDAVQIERAVRAYNPFPVCQAKFNDVVLKLWQAEACDAMSGHPGEVLAVDKSGITVACGRGALKLQMLQRPGGKSQPAVQFLQAMPVRAGDNFQVH